MQPQIEDVIPIVVVMENLQPEMSLERLCLVLLIVCLTAVYSCIVWDSSVLGTEQITEQQDTAWRIRSRADCKATWTMNGWMPSTGEPVKVPANSSKCFSLPVCVTFISYWLSLSHLASLQVLLHIRYLACRQGIFLGSVKRCRINTLFHRDDISYDTISVFFK